MIDVQKVIRGLWKTRRWVRRQTIVIQRRIWLEKLDVARSFNDHHGIMAAQLELHRIEEHHGPAIRV